MNARPRTVAEGFLAALADRGVEWVFGNAGTDFAPITEHGRLGSRNAPIHWGQEMFDQGGIVREFVKWDNELRAGEQVVDQVDRALAIAQAEPCGPVYLSLTLCDVIGADATVVNELGLAPAVMSFTGPHSFFGPTTSAGLGWGGGAALGAKLADPGRLVVWATGDGSYVFSNSMAVHHAAASQGLGLLMLIADNRVWNAVRRSTLAVYPDGAAARTARMPLSSLDRRR